MQINRKVHDGRTIIALNLAKSNPNFGTSVKKKEEENVKLDE